MEMNLQPPGSRCRVSGRDFIEAERVMSFLVRGGKGDEVLRFDVAEVEAREYQPSGTVLCRWTYGFKPRKAGENPEKTLKLTAESLFLTLADPGTEITPENARLLQVLALMLERKRVVKPRGTAAGGGTLYEHGKTKTIYTVPAAELTPEFFLSIQEQLAALVGGGGGTGGAPAGVSGE